ncbi:spore protease YyaC [Halobacillus salinarum]|uniref:Spore protease YyaC n=1 Tax=Halobacillus salinarum TaxID=2932257 RepID=A0ABY4EJW4_9BACI|nr:spore protease YyaC [Halobacillus salinarum]UOQ44766.1 spore protease YyaC [Halobacillus salinarum]
MNFKDKFSKNERRVNVEDAGMVHELSAYLEEWLPEKDVIIACIGTDRSTGDAFGPLIGSMLEEQTLHTFQIYGTLEHPLHALNLNERMKTIHRAHQEPFILAIDACLGKSTSVGCVSLGKGTIAPGAALKKELPPVGDLHISGMVNVSGFMEYVVLQNTRLHTVMKMAAKVAAAIQLTDSVRAKSKPRVPYQTITIRPKKQQL